MIRAAIIAGLTLMGTSTVPSNLDRPSPSPTQTAAIQPAVLHVAASTQESMNESLARIAVRAASTKGTELSRSDRLELLMLLALRGNAKIASR